MKLLDNKGHGPTGVAILLLLPGLLMLNNITFCFIAWGLILWFPVSLYLLFRRRKK